VPIKVLDVYWNPVVPSSFRITKSARGYQPVITSEDRKVAEGAIRELYGVFQTGFQTQFKNSAMARGISEVALVNVRQVQLPNPTPGRHQLFVDVTELSVGCNDQLCFPLFKLNGLLRNPGSSGSAMTFETSVGKQSAFSKVDAAVFEAFTQAVLDDWKAKGLLQK
jgi:hypothetical protein